MFNYNVNWFSFVRNNTPSNKRQAARLTWFDTVVSQVRRLHSIFLNYRQNVEYRLAHNGQVIYLTKFLNDQFDNSLRRIYIETLNNRSRFFLRNKVEARTKPYLYNKWNNATAYTVGQFAVYGSYVWKCILNHTNHTPAAGSIYWVSYKTKPFLQNKSELTGFNDFIIWVPTSLTFDSNVMKAWVNYYKLAGKRYTIQTY